MFKHKLSLIGVAVVALCGCTNGGESSVVPQNEEIIIHVKDYIKDCQIAGDTNDETYVFEDDGDGYKTLHLPKEEMNKQIRFSYPVRFDTKYFEEITLPNSVGEYYFVENQGEDGKVEGNFVKEKPVVDFEEETFFELKDKLLSFINYEGNISVEKSCDDSVYSYEYDSLTKTKTERSKTVVGKDGEIRYYEDAKHSYRIVEEESQWNRFDYANEKRRPTVFAESKDIQSNVFLNDYTKIALFPDVDSLSRYLDYKMELQNYYFTGFFSDRSLNQGEGRYALTKGENASGTTYSLTFSFKADIFYNNPKTSMRENKTLLDESTTCFEFNQEDKLTRISSTYVRDLQVVEEEPITTDKIEAQKDKLNLETITNRTEYDISYPDNLKELSMTYVDNFKEDEDGYSRFVPVYSGENYLYDEMFTYHETYKKNKNYVNCLTLNYYLDEALTKPLEDDISLDSFDKIYVKPTFSNNNGKHFIIEQKRYSNDKYHLFNQLYYIQQDLVNVTSLDEAAIRKIISDDNVYSINGSKDYQNMKIHDGEEYVVKYVYDFPKNLWNYNRFRF